MTNGIPANYLVASKCLGLDGKTFREMPESQEYLTENLGYDPKLAKEYYDKAMEECGLTSLTLTLQYNETSANNKAASEFLHKSFPEIFGDSFTLELMAAPSGVLNSYIKGWKDGDPNSFELQWRGWNTSTPHRGTDLKFTPACIRTRTNHITMMKWMHFGKKPIMIWKQKWIRHTVWN